MGRRIAIVLGRIMIVLRSAAIVLWLALIVLWLVIVAIGRSIGISRGGRIRTITLRIVIVALVAFATSSERYHCNDGKCHEAEVICQSAGSSYAVLPG